MSALERYEKLKRRLAKAREEKAKAEGTLAEIQRRLGEDFGCQNLDDAEVLLLELRQEETTARETFEADLTAFEEKWSEFLNE